MITIACRIKNMWLVKFRQLQFRWFNNYQRWLRSHGFSQDFNLDRNFELSRSRERFGLVLYSTRTGNRDRGLAWLDTWNVIALCFPSCLSYFVRILPFSSGKIERVKIKILDMIRHALTSSHCSKSRKSPWRGMIVLKLVIRESTTSLTRLSSSLFLVFISLRTRTRFFDGVSNWNFTVIGYLIIFTVYQINVGR